MARSEAAGGADLSRGSLKNYTAVTRTGKKKKPWDFASAISARESEITKIPRKKTSGSLGGVAENKGANGCAEV